MDKEGVVGSAYILAAIWFWAFTNTISINRLALSWSDQPFVFCNQVHHHHLYL